MKLKRQFKKHTVHIPYSMNCFLWHLLTKSSQHPQAVPLKKHMSTSIFSNHIAKVQQFVPGRPSGRAKSSPENRGKKPPMAGCCKGSETSYLWLLHNGNFFDFISEVLGSHSHLPGEELAKKTQPPYKCYHIFDGDKWTNPSILGCSMYLQKFSNTKHPGSCLTFGIKNWHQFELSEGWR